MNAELTRALIRRAVILYPRRDYISASSVRHARRQWLKSVSYLRETGRGWVIDGAVGWQMAATKREA